MRKGQGYQRIKILKHIIADFANPPSEGDLSEEVDEVKSRTLELRRFGDCLSWTEVVDGDG